MTRFINTVAALPLCKRMSDVAPLVFFGVTLVYLWASRGV
jgi:hypothetical protein